MYKRSRLVGILGCAAALAMVGCANNSGVTPLTGATTQQQAQRAVPQGLGWIEKDGVLYHVPHYMATVKAASKVRPAILLSYGNGPVLVKPKMYLIFWGYNTYGDADGVKPLLTNYSHVIGHSHLNNIYTQYYMKVGSVTTYIKNPRNQKGGIWEDDVNPVPTNPTDAQVAAEALNGVAHFGYDPNGSYVVATPHGHSSAGFGTSYCAYHSATVSNGKVVSYTNLPYMPDAGANCGANFITPPSDETGADEGVTIVEGHEYGESITDPKIFTGWNSGSGEIGDLCAWTNVQNDPFRTKSYSAQPMFSNATQSCVHSYP
jgi:serine protease